MKLEQANVNGQQEEKTDIIEFQVTHKPDIEKAELLKSLGKTYEFIFEATGKKCYEDSMKACFADAKDYESCGFVRSIGATV